MLRRFAIVLLKYATQEQRAGAQYFAAPMRLGTVKVSFGKPAMRTLPYRSLQTTTAQTARTSTRICTAMPASRHFMTRRRLNEKIYEQTNVNRRRTPGTDPGRGSRR